MRAAFFLYIASALLAVFCNASAMEVIDLGPSLSDLKALGIAPVADSASKTGFRIPNSYRAAADALENMLPPESIETITAADGIQSDFLSRDGGKFQPVSEWLYRNWLLGDVQSAAGNELRAMGFASRGWMARALFERIHEKHAGKSKPDVMVRLRRFSFIEQQDAMRPQSPPPSDCARANANIKSADIWLGQAENWPYGRIVSWVDCDDGTKKAYLWEREWFSPDPILTGQLKETP